MHTAQLILVEADSPEEAFQIVLQNIDEDDRPVWSDWNEVTYENSKLLNYAGRWTAPEIFGESHPHNFLCYADNPELADEVLGTFLSYRQQHLSEMLKTIDFSELQKLAGNYNPYGRESFDNNLFLSYKLTKILMNEWTWESGVYDLTADSTQVNYFVKRCSANPQNQYIIPVDFHH